MRDYLPPSAIPTDGSRLYLSRLDETNLIRLAAITGLSYHRLEKPEDLTHALLEKDLASEHRIAVDIRWTLALMALLLLLLTRFNLLKRKIPF